MGTYASAVCPYRVGSELWLPAVDMVEESARACALLATTADLTLLRLSLAGWCQIARKVTIITCCQHGLSDQAVLSCNLDDMHRVLPEGY